MCGQSCEVSRYHRDECQLLAAKNYQPQICFDECNPRKKHSAYCTIVPLRAILLKQKDPARWAKVVSMESHIETRKNTQLYAAIRSNVVPFIRGVLGLQKEASEEELMQIAGIFDTNSFEIRLPEQAIKIRALYELGALMDHSCQPNTKHYFDEEFNLVMIAAGECRNFSENIGRFVELRFFCFSGHSEGRTDFHHVRSIVAGHNPTSFYHQTSQML